MGADVLGNPMADRRAKVYKSSLAYLHVNVRSSFVPYHLSTRLSTKGQMFRDYCPVINETSGTVLSKRMSLIHKNQR